VQQFTPKAVGYQTLQEVFIDGVNKVMDLQSVQFHIAILGIFKK